MNGSRSDAAHAFVLEATAAGEIADFATRGGFDPQSKPIIDAGFVRSLMLGAIEGAVVLMPGVRIRGARLEGLLDLSDCSGAGDAGLPALSLDACDLPDRIDLSGARVARLSIRESGFRELWGVGLKIDGDFNFRRAFPLSSPEGEATAYIRMRAARIAGDVWGRNARLVAPRAAPQGMEYVPDALQLQSAVIGGSTLLDEGFSADGRISLFGLKIGGQLFCSGARFIPHEDGALYAENIEVSGDVRFSADSSGPCVCEDALYLGGSRIGGNLDFSGAHLSGRDGLALDCANVEVRGDLKMRQSGEHRFQSAGVVSLIGAEINGDLECMGALLNGGTTSEAMHAANAKIDGDIYFCSAGEQQFEASGEMSLRGASIGGNLICEAASLTNETGLALTASNAAFGGTVILTDGFQALGGVSFFGATIGGDLDCYNAVLRYPDGYALILDAAKIDGRLCAYNNAIDGKVSLDGARAGRLMDDPDSAWDGAAAVTLDEFTYDHLAALPDAAYPLWKARTRLLRRNVPKEVGAVRGAFLSQPWRECAAAFTRAGLTRDARRIAREEQRSANRARSFLQRTLVWLFAEVPFGYGLSVTRSVLTSAIFWIVGWIGVDVMLSRGALVDAIRDPGGGSPCKSVAAPLYALDTAIPFLDLRQELLCDPGAATNSRLFSGFAISGLPSRVLEEVAVWRWLKVLYSLLGAIVIGFTVLTCSGVFKPRGDA